MRMRFVIFLFPVSWRPNRVMFVILSLRVVIFGRFDDKVSIIELFTFIHLVVKSLCVLVLWITALQVFFFSFVSLVKNSRIKIV